MPIYRYVTIPPEGEEPESFEVHQRLAEPPLAHHPESGVPVRRVITPSRLLLAHSEQREQQILSDANVERHGFTRYERVGDGTYARTAGTRGPKVIHK